MSTTRVAGLALAIAVLVVGLMAWAGRYQTVAVPDQNGRPGIARTDRLTGDVTFCFPENGATVRCIDQR